MAIEKGLGKQRALIETGDGSSENGTVQHQRSRPPLRMTAGLTPATLIGIASTPAYTGVPTKISRCSAAWLFGSNPSGDLISQNPIPQRKTDGPSDPRHAVEILVLVHDIRHSVRAQENRRTRKTTETTYPCVPSNTAASKAQGPPCQTTSCVSKKIQLKVPQEVPADACLLVPTLPEKLIETLYCEQI